MDDEIRNAQNQGYSVFLEHRAHERKAAAAVRTLAQLRYTYTDGAELWKPPLGPAPDFENRAPSSNAEFNARLKNYILEVFVREAKDKGLSVQQALLIGAELVVAFDSFLAGD